MYSKRLQKYVCCTLNLTIGTRIIGFFGLTVSVLLITVLINDKYSENGENYYISRNTALALGLDWEHFHYKASTAQKNDPEGKKITIIVIFYAVTFLVTNLLLCFATIQGDWKYAVPWLLCEFIGCLSKFGALIYHVCTDPNDLSNIFITGSVFYIVVMMWWWVVVFLAQLSWKRKECSLLTVELTDVTSVSKKSQDVEEVPGSMRYFRDSLRDGQFFDSPGPYSPNNMYALI